MSAESELFAALNVPSVNALVSGRIYPDFMPEDAAHPAIVWARSTTEPIDSIAGTHFGSFVSFAVTAWATTRTQADAVADAIEPALRLAKHQVTGRDAGADEVGLRATTITVTILAI